MSARSQYQNDAEIVKGINARLYWDKRVSRTDIKVEALDGAVTISGRVDSKEKKVAALEVVYTTEGVWTVNDKLIVQGNFQRTDRDLAAILRREIAAFALLPGEYVNVEVIAGVARLTGKVCRRHFKAFAASICWELSGIRDCLNQIVLKGSGGRPVHANRPVELSLVRGLGERLARLPSQQELGFDAFKPSLYRSPR